jgi:hypothetical protein
VSQRVTLVPRVPPVPASALNAWLEARGDVQRLEADSFLVELANADIASQAEIATAPDGEPIRRVSIVMGSGGAPYGTSLVSEVRKLCEELAARFDLLVELPGGRKKAVDIFFDEGGL